MKILTQQRAAELRSRGITQLASIVKSHYASSYYNVNTIDEVMSNDGRWIPALRCMYNGVLGTRIDWAITELTVNM